MSFDHAWLGGMDGRLAGVDVQVAVVEWELILGLWLLTGAVPVAARIACFITFLAFAGVSFYLGMIGQASCGCFGAIQASPWHAFAFDVGILILLILSKFMPKDRTLANQQIGRHAAGLVGGVILCLGLATGMGSVVFGSPNAALAYLRGESVTVRPSFLDVGAGKAGDVVEASVEVVNWTDKVVLVYGGTSDCSCIATSDLPLQIEPGKSSRMVVRVRLPNDGRGLFSRKAFLRTDCERARIVTFGLTGRIEPR